jgi:hypothetical protein
MQKHKTYFNAYHHLYQAQAAALVWEAQDVQTCITQTHNQWALWLDSATYDQWARGMTAQAIREVKRMANRAAKKAHEAVR